ncbi:MAG TPA: hypothetical protein ENI23_02820 [bacterium]|nr:hypothetical protein [bacterium]
MTKRSDLLEWLKRSRRRKAVIKVMTKPKVTSQIHEEALNGVVSLRGGAKIGFRGFLGSEYSTGSFTIGAELGYRSTGEVETTGELTITEGGVVLVPPEEMTGKLDFSGLYILFGIGFAV